MIKYTNRRAPGGANAVSYYALESLDEFKEIVANADVIWAVPRSREGGENGKPAGPCIVYGQSALMDIVISNTPKRVKVVAFALDFASDQVEHLLASVGVVKGHYEWNGEEHRLAETANLEPLLWRKDAAVMDGQTRIAAIRQSLKVRREKWGKS